MLAEVRIRGVGSTQSDGLLVGEHTVAALTCAGTCKDIYLEGTSGFVLSVSFLCQFCGYAFRNASRSEARETQRVAILDLCCGFGSCDAL